jgi:hypothetical protein
MTCFMSVFSSEDFKCLNVYRLNKTYISYTYTSQSKHQQNWIKNNVTGEKRKLRFLVSNLLSFSLYSFHSNIAIDWIFMSPQISVLKPNPHCDGVLRWDLWEVIRTWESRVNRNGISVLLRETPESCLGSFTMWDHNTKTAIYEPTHKPSTVTKSTNYLTLGFPVSRTVKNNCLLFISHLVCDVLWSQLEQIETKIKSKIIM